MRRLLQSWLLGFVRLIASARGRYANTPPSTQQTIYFANHASHADTLAILAALPLELRAHVRPVAARDYWDATPLRRFIGSQVLGVVYVTRQSAKREDPLQMIREALTEGWSIIVFPEGTRSLTGEIAPFKSGLYRLSSDFPDVKLVPVYLSDLIRVIPKGRWLPVPINCQVLFGDPVPGAAGCTKSDFLTRARDAVLHLQHSITNKP
ncbi:MAG: 1-acyl-sn-glycerol-3-phosphate acyltransferase [Methylobacillus sp.]|jgi:1-acyl-sn-glycerol-3-phosphate acyltransferase|nr:1-acyl-sn-glycerol-3-phosphate acyltransferase [Methylobacillus sp.]